MRRRSCLVIPALGLLASLTLTTPGKASSVVTVSEAFTISTANYSPTLESLTLSFSGLNGISGLTFLGAANTNPLGPVNTPLSYSAPAESVTISFTPQAFSAAGTISFETSTSAKSLSALQSEIKLTGESVMIGLGGQGGGGNTLS
jgi:hypothetical protein